MALVAPHAMSAHEPPAAASGARIEGRVTDPAGAVIAGAQVRASLSRRVPPVSTTTDNRGVFQLPVSPGTWIVTVSMPGFAETRRQLAVGVEAIFSVDIELPLAAIDIALVVQESPDYLAAAASSATRTLTALQDIPQSVSIVTKELMQDQLMMSIGDVVRYVPGISAVQGENNRDQVVIRGNNSSADFFLNGLRDDVQYFRDLYNLERVEALKGPNAMIFGRGGGGGVINRVSKEAGFAPLRELTIQGGGFGHKRIAGDINQPLNRWAAFRLNSMYENSGSFRNFVNLERYGLSPTLTLTPSSSTGIRISYEHLSDHRIGDRGVPSFRGRPVNVAPSAYFGNPAASPVRAGVDVGSVSAEHQRGRLNLRNRTLFGGYDRFYVNYVPGTLSADQSRVALSAYDNATQRVNFFNQTDAVYARSLGFTRHTFLVGAEVGRQITDNLRNTGYFDNTALSITAPFTQPVINHPITFRQSATDANNHIRTTVAATYVQDQIELSRHVQVVAGLRFDRFDLNYFNNRNRDMLRRTDHLLSPRLGLVVKPVAALSLYGSYSVSYLPSSGDQFASLTTITQQVKPEQFMNYEVGAKWEANRNIFFTAALYQLDRTNTRSVDPNDPTRIVQTGSQRSRGLELGINGRLTRRWQVSGGYALQEAVVTSATTAARAGAHVEQVPRHSFSFWNNVQLRPRLGLGLGLLNRSDMYATIDNTVTLPSYTRADAALFYSFTDKLRLQANLENLTNRRYFLNAHTNTNISPGSPRVLRVGLTMRF
ncbi:MAG: TonB-dependent siderophore receptor [Acidobacteria bacterium]|nr:TonB-dependent siderophore receptor [Acidobacteriota bacterium]